MAGRKAIINPQTIDKGPKTSQAQHFPLSQLHLALPPQVQPIKQGEDAPGSHFTSRRPTRRLQTHTVTSDGARGGLVKHRKTQARRSSTSHLAPQVQIQCLCSSETTLTREHRRGVNVAAPIGDTQPTGLRNAAV